MKTRCTHCHAVFTVTEEQLSRRDGQVRCGRCRQIFNAYDNLLDDARLPLSAYRHPPPNRRQLDRERSRIRAAEPTERIDAGANRAAPRRGAGNLVFVCTVLSVLVLLIQGALVFRNQIVYFFPQSRSVLLQLCALKGCELGTMRHSDQVKLSDVRLKTRPDQTAEPGQMALLLQGRLSNQSDSPSPWPALVLSLTDAQGSVAVRRIIEPEEYLPGTLSGGELASQTDYPFNLPITVRKEALKGFRLSLYFSKE